MLDLIQVSSFGFEMSPKGHVPCVSTEGIGEGVLLGAEA